MLYSGDSSASPLIGKYCGNLLPPNVISSTNRAFIHFHTDDTETKTGFELEYKAISGKLAHLQLENGRGHSASKWWLR